MGIGKGMQSNLAFQLITLLYITWGLYFKSRVQMTVKGKAVESREVAMLNDI